MFVVFSVKREPALKKSSLNDFQSFAILTRSRTKRLQKALCELGLKIGGQAGANVGSELGISGSRDTILRLVRQSRPSAQSEPHVIGLDDWARKRRLRYGTLICDLELGLPIDLLPDRSVETVSAWLLKHPSITVVSRDGSSEYASAIQKGAPQARPRERPLAFSEESGRMCFSTTDPKPDADLTQVC
jgi:transposase